MKFRIFLVISSCLLSAMTGLIVSRKDLRERSAKAPSLVTIGLSMDTLKEERWQSDRDFFVRRAQDMGAQVLIQAANSDDARQIQDVQALISRNVDVLVIVPHNGAAMAKAARLAREANIPIIAYDRLITDSELDLYISFDAVKAGEMQARYLAERFAGKGRKRIVRIHGAKTDHNAFLFKQGQDQVLEPLIRSGEVEVIHEDWAENWKPENAKRIANAAITRFGTRFDAILAANDGTAGGAIQALLEEDAAGKILVTGQDAELAACQRIARGTQAMTIYKPLKRLAEKAAEVAVRMALGKPVIAGQEVDNGKVRVPAILMDVVVVTPQNILDTVIRDGFHSYDAVYAGAPSDKRPQR